MSEPWGVLLTDCYPTVIFSLASSSSLFYLQPVRSQGNILMHKNVMRNLLNLFRRHRLRERFSRFTPKYIRERLASASQARSYTSRAFSPTHFRYRTSNLHRHVLSKAEKLFWQSCCFTRTNISETSNRAPETLFHVKRVMGLIQKSYHTPKEKLWHARLRV